MPQRFFGQQISVDQDSETRDPVAFSFGGESHKVAQIMTSWHDYGFPDDGRQHRWWQRRHRNYYRVRTTEGRDFEIYYDRGVSMDNPKYMRWYVSQEF